MKTTNRGVLVIMLLGSSNAFTSSRRRFRSASVPTATGSTTAVAALQHNSILFSPSAAAAAKDRQREQGRQRQRQKYVVVNSRHSASDWLYNVKSLPHSTILREVRGPVVAVALWSAIVSVVHHLLPQPLANHLCIAGTMHSFLVSALGLLLVFRTNSAYQRFCEGRKIWENVLSISRNLSRMVQLYSKEVGNSRKRRILNLVAAYPYLLRHHIRPGCLCRSISKLVKIDPRYLMQLKEPPRVGVETRHEGDQMDTEALALRGAQQCWVDIRELPWSLFDQNDQTRRSRGKKASSLEEVAKAHNRPLWVCDTLGQQIMEIPYGPNFTSRERLAMLGQVEKLTNAVGQCERIHQTAVPLNYARHSLRSLTLWLFTLPFCLIKEGGLLTAPITACIAWVLLGVYQIGYSIEDPFQGSLRLSTLCDAIRRDVLGDMTTDNVVELRMTTSWNDDSDDDDVSGEKNNIIHNAALEQSPPPHQYVPLPRIEGEETFLRVTPKLIQENGTWNVVDALKP